MRIAAKVANDKEKHPEKFCPVSRCLWRTGGGYCPRHERKTNAKMVDRVDSPVPSNPSLP